MNPYVTSALKSWPSIAKAPISQAPLAQQGCRNEFFWNDWSEFTCCDFSVGSFSPRFVSRQFFKDTVLFLNVCPQLHCFLDSPFVHDVANVKFELAVDDCARNAYIYDHKVLSRVVVPAAAFLEAAAGAFRLSCLSDASGYSITETSILSALIIKVDPRLESTDGRYSYSFQMNLSAGTWSVASSYNQSQMETKHASGGMSRSEKSLQVSTNLDKPILLQAAVKEDEYYSCISKSEQCSVGDSDSVNLHANYLDAWLHTAALRNISGLDASGLKIPVALDHLHMGVECSSTAQYDFLTSFRTVGASVSSQTDHFLLDADKSSLVGFSYGLEFEGSVT